MADLTMPEIPQNASKIVREVRGSVPSGFGYESAVFVRYESGFGSGGNDDPVVELRIDFEAQYEVAAVLGSSGFSSILKLRAWGDEAGSLASVLRAAADLIDAASKS